MFKGLFSDVAAPLNRDSVEMRSDWYSKWIVLTCAFFTFLLIDGVRLSFGVLFVDLLETFKAGKDNTAWIGSIQIGISNFAGVVAGSSAQHFGVMKTVIVGTLLSSLGLFATSFSTNIYIMYFAFGFLPGLGFSMMGLPTIVGISHNFDKHQSLALGASQAGGSIGGFLFNPILQIFIQKFGWEGALLLMSAIMLHGILFALLINVWRRKDIPITKEEEEKKPFNYEQTDTCISKNIFYMDSLGSITLVDDAQSKQYTSDENDVIKHCFNKTFENDVIVNSSFDSELQQNCQGETDNMYDERKQDVTVEKLRTNLETQHKRRLHKHLSMIINQVLPCRVLKDCRTFMFLIAALIRSFGFFVPFVLLPDLAVENGIDIERAAWLASAMGISGRVCRILAGMIADFQSVDRLYLYMICLLGSGVLSAVCPSFQSFGLLMVYAIIFSSLMGAEPTLTPVICSDVAGKDKLAETYGMLNTLCGVGATCGTPLSGWLFEVTGGYRASFVMAGTLIAVSGVILLPLKFYKTANKQI